VIIDRREAIEYALNIAKENDVIVLAGKGHETYQVLQDKTIIFDEKMIIKEYLRI
jgi:UDP-N-acetylmuramoyl-L-alanyl-D-glutamate--2,6-diaminopimelate ligase